MDLLMEGATPADAAETVSETIKKKSIFKSTWKTFL